MRSIFVPWLLAAILAGAGGDAGATTENREAPTSGRPELGEAANATFRGIYDHPVTLEDGIYEGRPFVENGAARPRVELIRDFEMGADLDDDGSEETVVLLSESPGGSGTFLYLAILERQGNAVENTGTAAIGDRVQIRGWRAEGGTIVLAVVQAGPEDAACCPSQLMTRRWELDSDGLKEGPSELRGTLSLETVEAVEWRLVAFDLDEEAPEEPPVTLVFYGDKVGGNSGCNRYMGSAVAGPTPGELEFGPLAGTMMACPGPVMDLERRFLGLLEDVKRFSFHLGRLALTSVDGEGNVRTLLFEGQPAFQQPD